MEWSGWHQLPDHEVETIAVTGLQRCDEEIHGLFGSCVDFF
jgi:hypothetical protein